MTNKKAPKILIVTPEVTYLPDRMGSLSDCLTAKAGGLADVSASLICELFRQGADVHAAIPNYKAIFGDCLASYLQKEQTSMRRVLPKDRLHLAEDRIFFHRERIYSGNGDDNLSLSLAFQREVINNIALQKKVGLIEYENAPLFFGLHVLIRFKKAASYWQKS